jgi:tripartite-type tricarboxylate transporter receptor subunit TctC
VVLCRYNLSRVERAARKARTAAWATVPTVLEAGGASGPGAAFFPFPKAAASSNPFGFGVTVNLAAGGSLDFTSELLHFRLDYTLDDFAMVGEITDEVTDAQLAIARQRHFDLLEQDLQYRTDVP